MGALGVNMMSVAINLLQTQFGGEPETISLISSTYFIAQIVGMPAVPILVKRFGLQAVTKWAIALFSATSVCCAIASSVMELALFRGFQGMSGGVFAPLTYIYIKHYIDAKKHSIYLAYFSISASLSIAMGPSLVSFIPEGSGISWLFWLNIPVMIIAYFMICQVDNLASIEKEGHINKNNILSLFTIMLSLGSLVFVLDRGRTLGWFESRMIVNFLTIGVIAFWIFVFLQWRNKDKLLNYHLLCRRQTLWVYFCSFLAGVLLYGVMYAIPLYLSSEHNYDAMLINKVLLFTALPQILLLPVAAYLSRKVEPWTLFAIGSALFAISCFMSTDMSSDYAGEQFSLPQILRAVAMPLFLMPLTVLSMAKVADHEMASSAIYFGVFRLLGGAFGLSLMVTYIQQQRDGNYLELMSYTQLDAETTHSLSNVIAFNDVFYLFFITLTLLSLVTLLAKTIKLMPKTTNTLQ